MKDWYTEYYAKAPYSKAHATFCEQVYGKDLCQHGFMDMAQLDTLLEVVGLTAQDVVFDLGCGNGMIAEYISDCTSAHVYGMDYIPAAITQARDRTRAKADRLTFDVGDINAIDYPAESFDVILSIDTLYFGELDHILSQLARILKPKGRLAAFYGIALWEDETLTKENLAADKTPLALNLAKHGFSYQAWDFTDADYRHAQRRLEILPTLKAQFEGEDIQFIYQNRLDEANGTIKSTEERACSRFLYLAEQQ
jgi:ubiquinone/menaquinone biosynthesis C-methylase UbiE